MGHESEHSKTVVDGNQDDVLGCKLLSVELRLESPAFAAKKRKLNAGDVDFLKA